MKKFLALLSLSFASMSALAAPPTDESIRTLFAVMKSEALVESIYTSMENFMSQSINQARGEKELTEKQKKALENLPQELSALFKSEFSWAKIEPFQIKIYRESFEQAEIDGLIEFYRSPVGQSYINKIPLVAQKAMTETQAYLLQVMPKIKATIAKRVSDAKSAR